MAFASAVIPGMEQSFSVGPVKMQVLEITAASGDTSGTVVADKLQRIDHVVVSGGLHISAKTITGNSVALTFADPLANIVGSIIFYGR
jgi:hypothetical protein